LLFSFLYVIDEGYSTILLDTRILIQEVFNCELPVYHIVECLQGSFESTLLQMNQTEQTCTG